MLMMHGVKKKNPTRRDILMLMMHGVDDASYLKVIFCTDHSSHKCKAHSFPECSFRRRRI
jgi:hypothetical protein